MRKQSYYHEEEDFIFTFKEEEKMMPVLKLVLSATIDAYHQCDLEEGAQRETVNVSV